jgi:polyphosphate kinase
LKFNERVLHETLDERTPHLYRLKFLEIFTSNLDEFFMKRIELLRSHTSDPLSASAKADHSLRDQIRSDILNMLARQNDCFQGQLRPSLAKHGVHLLVLQELTADQSNEASQYFLASVLLVVTPLAYDPVHRFPFLSNLSTSLGVVIRTPGTEQQLFARVKVPATLPLWIGLKASHVDNPRSYLPLVEVMRHNLDLIFPGMEIVSTTLFRITRDAEVQTTGEEPEDFRQTVQAGLLKRRFEPVVRVEFGPQPDLWGGTHTTMMNLTRSRDSII